MKKIYLLLILICLGFQVFSQTSTYIYTGSVQTFPVPAGVSALAIDMMGGCGGDAYICCGGTNPVTLGGRVQCTINVTPSSTLYVYVGGAGANWTSSTSLGGWNGGGTGGLSGDGFAAGGGGASDIRTSSSGAYATSVIAVAGGGGGGGDFSEAGGLGGGTTGGTGTGGACGGGQAGPSCGTGYTSGTQGQGASPNQYSCGGGGGGWWGGNSGVYLDGGGGGGSSYPASPNATVTAITHTQGYSGANGNGQVIITVLCQAPGSITGTLSVCAGSTTTLADATGAAGGSWTSSNTAVATVGPSTGVVTGVAPGNATIAYVVSSPCGGANASAVVTVNAVPSAITGTASACPAGMSTLSSAPGGGTWSSGTSGVATIGASTGVVTAGSPGTSTITYTLSDGCPNATKTFTVNPNPAAVTGAAAMCGGSLPTSVTLSDGTAGGTWSSSNTALATVNSSGVVTGVAGGNPTISYTLSSTGCFATTTVTVNAVAPIAGSLSICIGTSSTLTDLTSGGNWTSSNTAIATIGSSTGVATSVAIGAATISYTVPSIGCSALQTINVTTATPTVFAVTGGGAYCSGGAGVHVGLNGSNGGVTYSLYNGATVVATMSGTGSTIDFGLFTTTGSYSVIANPGTPCATNMSGSATVSINLLPTAYSVSGSGSYCSGGSGLHVTLNTSAIGINYQLMLGGTTPIGLPVAGTGGTLDFGPQTTAGTYTVVATNASTGCVATMSGSAIIGISALPTAFAVTGGGGYCIGGSGVHIGLSGSTVGTTYQLLISGSPVGSPLSGTGIALDFGAITAAGSYTVFATNTATGCTGSMSGSVTVTVNSLPTAFTVTGGGAYCSGGTGVAIGLNSSTSGVNYQLFNGLLPSGAPVAGTGVALSFPLQTVAGAYTVVATNTTTGCVNNMFGSVSVSINPLPVSFGITGGGSYCAGGAGVPVGLSGSTIGITYSLFNGTTLIGAASGTGGPVSFGLQILAGTYTVTATNTLTGCAGNNSGSVTITINPLPTVFTVTGGGSFCAGGTGAVVGLNGSTSGINYQLYNGSTAIGAVVAGTGGTISFGLQTAAGSYTVIAINATTTCTNNMAGSALITVNPLPTIYAMTGGGGYCAGSGGLHVGLTASNTGISYQLKTGGSPVGAAVAGTGFPIDFGIITTAGTYSVTATNPSTSCTVNMTGTSVITINALPTPYVVTVTGGGQYCAGGAGVHVGLGNSDIGVNYQLLNGISAIGSAFAGTGAAIDFGLQTTAGSYTVVATNAATGCVNNMTGSATITINPLPVAFTVTGGGNYCAGSTGPHVGLSGSAAGITYQLMNGFATVGAQISGTGSSLDFGIQTAAGIYTVVATNPVTTCTDNMTGSVTINVNPLPGLNTITGGGPYCFGGTGVHIGLNGSALGIKYQLYLGLTPVGTAMSGTGLPIDFGLNTTVGVYTVIGTNTTTGCQSTMTGSTTVVVNPLPALHTILGGGNYCTGGTGETIGLDGSSTGANYQLYNGGTPVGAPAPGSTGVPISFGLQTASGTYIVVGTNTATGCSTNMTGSATVGVFPLPIVYNVTGGGNYCSGGLGVHVVLSGSVAGTMYQLWNGTLMVGSALPGTGHALDFGSLTTPGTYTVTALNLVTSCSNNMSGSATIGTTPVPTVYSVTGGGDYCAGTSGVAVGLSSSDLGINYRLYNGSAPIGSAIAGTGAALNFGLQTAGSYTVIATNTGTACTSVMTGTVIVNVDPLPTAYTLTGGGNYCTGGAGVDILLSSSDPGNSYQLFNGTTMVGPAMPGTGLALDLGMQTAPGTYTVVATSTLTSCSNNMAGSVVISVSPSPIAFTVGGGGNYCAGGAGVHVTLSSSTSGVNYQLWNGVITVGPAKPGTGAALDFGLQTMTGTYTVQATNSTTSCTNMMSGSVTIGTYPLPNVYSVSSGTSNYCAGGTGVDISLSGSDLGVNYQLYNGITAVGTPSAGSGSAIDFGYQFGAGHYSVVAMDGTTGCTSNMSGGVNVIVNPLPSAYTVTGGGGYCNGGSGAHVGLSGSNVGISYQLYRNGILVPGSVLSGTSGPVDFGLLTVAGNYTVIATDMTTTCTNNMTGSVTIAVNPLPASYTVTGGGNYCSGGAGFHVGLSASSLSVHYQLYKNGFTAIGAAVTGTGTSLDFGAQTAAGVYTVVATDAITGCSATMSGNAIIGVNPAPAAWPVIGGGNFCAGGTGVHIGISGSTTGISYQLYNGTSTSGPAIIGAGLAVDFGLQTVAGTYTVVATNTVTGCTGIMPGSVIVVINPLPTAYAVGGGGNYCAGAAGVHIGIANSGLGVNYTLMNGITTVVTIPGTGGPIDFGLQTVAGTYTAYAINAATGCSANMTGSATVVVNPVVSPFVSVSASIGDTICSGNFTTFTAVTINGGTSPAYQWSINGVPAGAGSTYSYVPLNGDVVGVTLTSSAMCASPALVNSSLTMTVDANETPAVTVTTNPGTIVCQSTSVTFTAIPSYGGTAPVYSWVKNGVSVGTPSPTYSYVPANGDVVYCAMTSNYHCRLANTGTSLQSTMEVDQPVAPVVTITAHPGLSIAAGEPETFTATVTNGGPSPTYQWKVNNAAVPGATTSTYTSDNFFDGDVVTCEVLSSGGCSGISGSGSVAIHVIGVSVKQISAAGGDIKLIPNPNNGMFTLKGTLGTTMDEEVSFEMTDMLGQVVYRNKVMTHNGAINEKVQLSNIANGMYMLNLHSDSDNKVFHVVIEQ